VEGFRESVDSRFVASPSALPASTPYTKGNWYRDGRCMAADANRASCVGNPSFAFATCLTGSSQFTVGVCTSQYPTEVDGAGITWLPRAGDDETVTLPWSDPLLVWANRNALNSSSPKRGSSPSCITEPRPGLLFSANSCQKPKLYIDFDSTQNSRLLPSCLGCFRQPANHYLKVIQREHIGAAKEKEELQRELETWLNQYVTEDKSPSRPPRRIIPCPWQDHGHGYRGRADFFA